ncbi:MAG: DUF1995 family protein [Phormidesmis sp.]
MSTNASSSSPSANVPPSADVIPNSLPAATAQAQAAVQAALKDGYTRIQVEMAIPEIKHQPIAEQFLETFTDQQFKVFFPDAGAAALARRDWGNPDFVVRGLGELVTPIEPDDDLYLIVNPSSIEVATVESMCNEAADRPVVLLNPQLEDVAIVGIGYAARQLRERFLSQIETCYYVRPLEGAVVYRCYPSPWQIWRESEPDEYEWVSDVASRPSGEDIDRILGGESVANASSESDDSDGSAANKPKAGGRKKGLIAELQQFLKALSQ